MFFFFKMYTLFTTLKSDVQSHIEKDDSNLYKASVYIKFLIQLASSLHYSKVDFSTNLRLITFQESGHFEPKRKDLLPVRDLPGRAEEVSPPTSTTDDNL